MAENTTSNYDAAVQSEDDAADARPETDRSVKDQIMRKHGKIKTATMWMESGRWWERWSNFVKIYSNQYPYEELKGYENPVVPNHVWAIVNVIVPSVAVNNPEIQAQAHREDQAETAELVAHVANAQWRDLKVQRQVARCVKDAVLIGMGIAKVGWRNETRMRDLRPDELEQMFVELVQQRQQAIEANPLSERDLPTVDEIWENLPETVEEVVADEPSVDRVSWGNMLFDPDSTHFDDCNWICEKVYVPYRQARNNEDWSLKARKQFKRVVMSESRDKLSVVDESNDSAPLDSAYVCVYEFYDLIDGTVCTFAEGGEHFLKAPEEVDVDVFPRKHPYRFLSWTEVPERLFPMGEVETIYPQQLELAFIRSSILDDLKNKRLLTMVRPGSIGPDGMDALQSPKRDPLIDVLTDDDFGSVLAQIQEQALPPQWMGETRQLADEMTQSSGVSEYARGGMPDIRRTATEAGLIQDHAQARQADKLARVEEFMSDIAEDMIRLSQQFLEVPGVARYTTGEQVEVWQEYTREDLQGEFSFMVAAGSTQPVNESFKRQRAMQMMDIVSPLLGTGKLNDTEVLKHLFRDGFGIRDVERYVNNEEMVPREEVEAMLAELQGAPPPGPGSGGMVPGGGPGGGGEGAPPGGGAPGQSPGPAL